MHNKHILYARGGIKATPYPKSATIPPPHSNIPAESVFAVVHHVIYVNTGTCFIHGPPLLIKHSHLFHTWATRTNKTQSLVSYMDHPYY